MRSKVLAALSGSVRPGDTLCCALSGGADSVAMTHCVLALAPALGVQVTAAHFNHRLRGEESDGDEAFCRSLCRTLGIALTVGSADVAARAAETGESLEEAARICRYGFLETLPGLVLTAHTADDQAETLLLNLIRGTGLKGLGGIPPVRGTLVRPMLAVTRQEVLTYLEENDLPHREDATNGEDHHLRNRLRHRVIPLLKEENPNLLCTLGRTARLLRRDEALLEEQAGAILLGSRQTGWAVEPLRSAPEALRRRALRRVLTELGVSKLSARHLESAEKLVLGDDPSGQIHLPGQLLLRREYDRLLADPAEAEGFVPVILPCPGEVTVPELGLTFRCGETGAPITIRPRRAGDVIRLPGGSKTVKKLLIDRKIPAAKRACVPVLEREGQVLAVWGVAAAEPLNITTQKEENR